MSFRPTFDPQGSASMPVDKLLGNAYPVVKTVYDHLPQIDYLAANIDGLVELTETNKDAAAASATLAGQSATAAAASAVLADADRLASQAAAVSATENANATEADKLVAEDARQLAQNWASQLGTPVNGTDYSAKYHALAAAASLVAVKNLYYGAFAADPTLRPDGTAMVAGDRYYNTTSPAEKVFTGSAWQIPNVGAADLANLTDAAKGSALVAFLQAGTGAVGRTLADKQLESVSVLDFMTGAQRTAARTRSYAVDHLAAIELAQNYLASVGGGELRFPDGGYALSGPIRARQGISLVGAEGMPTLKNTNGVYNFFNSSILIPGNFHPEYVGALTLKDCGTIAVGNTVTLSTAGQGATFAVGDNVVVAANEEYTSSGFFIQKYLFLNEVIGISGDTLTLRYDIDQSFAGGVVKLDGTVLARNGNALFFWKDAAIRNFKIDTIGYWIADSAALNCSFENLHFLNGKTPVYGNTYQRSRWRKLRGRFFNGVGEMSLCSLKTTVEDFDFDYYPDAGTPSPVGLSMQENGRGIVYRNGKINFAGAALGASIVNFINAAGCTVKDVEITQSGLHANPVVQCSDTSATGRILNANNTVERLTYAGVQCARYYNITGDNTANVAGNRILNSRFSGTVTSGECGRMVSVQGRNSISGCEFADGKPIFGATSTGQELTDCFIADGVNASAEPDFYAKNFVRNLRSDATVSRLAAQANNVSVLTTSGTTTLALIDALLGTSLAQRDVIEVNLRVNITGTANTKTLVVKFRNNTDSTDVVFLNKAFAAATAGTFNIKARIYLSTFSNIVYETSILTESGGTLENTGGVITTDLTGKSLSLQAQATCATGTDSMQYRMVRSELKHPFLI